MSAQLREWARKLPEAWKRRLFSAWSLPSNTCEPEPQMPGIPGPRETAEHTQRWSGPLTSTPEGPLRNGSVEAPYRQSSVSDR